MNVDEELDVYISNNELGDIQWQNGYFPMRGTFLQSGEISKKLPFQTPETDPICNNCWRYHSLWFDFRNPVGPYNVGIEIYKGINLIYRNIQGQSNYWGAKDNEVTDIVNIPGFDLLEYASQ